jgi:PIN domain nuclease of toxin-antitoxin system
MTETILDTHTLVWWLMTPEQLGKGASKVIAKSERLGVSAISFWEIAMLARKQRIELGTDTDTWIGKAVRIPRLTVHDIGWRTATLADSLTMHADPADRFIAATTIERQGLLLTKDSLLRSTPFIKTLW